MLISFLVRSSENGVRFEISDTPNPRQLVKLKNRYMADIKRLVEGEPESAAAEEKTDE